MTAAEAKARRRAEIRARLKELPAAAKAEAAKLICGRVPAQDFWKSAKAVLLYAPLPDEVNIWPLLEAALAEGKLLALPRYDSVRASYGIAQVKDLELDLVRAEFSVLEPAAHCPSAALAEIEVALIPGIGFDEERVRLGRGKGFYDVLLAGWGGFKCGIALDEQVGAALPFETHDVRMNVVLTQTRVVGAGLPDNASGD